MMTTQEQHMKTTDLSHDPLALTILALLAEKPQHPYALQRLMRERKKDFAYSTLRTLYHAIDRLVKAGLILPTTTERAGNRPERTVYQIADEGREAFLSWLGELVAQPSPDFPLFTVAMSFLAHLPMQIAMQALQTRAVELAGELAGLEARLQGLSHHLHRLLLLELEYLHALRRAELDWVQSLVQDMRDGHLVWDAAALQQHPEALILDPTLPADAADPPLRLIDGHRADAS
jgi:DNA-binding PadR family transcriptional regulator